MAHLIQFRPENLHLLRALLDHGARVNEPDSSGCTPLWWAIDEDYNSTVHMLLERGATAQARGILVHAVRCVEAWSEARGQTDTGVISDLLDHGANINQPEDGGWTPLWTAIESNCVDAVRLLLARHADVTLRYGGMTPLSCALLNDNPQSRQIVRLLKAAGARK